MVETPQWNNRGNLSKSSRAWQLKTRRFTRISFQRISLSNVNHVACACYVHCASCQLSLHVCTCVFARACGTCFASSSRNKTGPLLCLRLFPRHDRPFVSILVGNAVQKLDRTFLDLCAVALFECWPIEFPDHRENAANVQHGHWSNYIIYKCNMILNYIIIQLYLYRAFIIYFIQYNMVCINNIYAIIHFITFILHTLFKIMLTITQYLPLKVN